MIMNKPVINIYVHESSSVFLQEICAGMEEEGLLYQVYEWNETDARLLASKAASESSLDTGVGITAKSIAFTISSLKPNQPITYIENPNREQCRNLGANAARAVKRMPFQINEVKR